jgi:zinc protease
VASSRLIRICISAAYSRGRVAALAFLVVLALAPAGVAQDLKAPLPVDASVRTGTLPNGLKFFIRRNPRPADRVMLRLAVQAGSVDEAEDQRGLAHVLEHMAFNGTSRFKPGELVSYLQSIGARFGAHVNAYTSYDETVYMLDVPTDRPNSLQRGFDALSDFAGGMTLDAAEVEKERGVVIEEWRGRLGAGTRMQQPQIEAIFGPASQYSKRLPIGTPESLKSFTVKRLRDFYTANYRANRMAVIAVGDLNPDEIERMIRQRFGAMSGARGPQRRRFPIPPHRDTRFVTVSDREAQGTTVSVIFKGPFHALETLEDYRRSLVDSLAYQMINARFSELARRPDAPFLAASAGSDTFGGSVDAASFGVRVKDGETERGLTALTTEIARVRQFGFGEAELDRARRGALAQYERLYNERNNTTSEPLASELLRHYLTREAVPGIERELEYARRFLATITTAEVSAFAREIIHDDNRVVLSSAPDRQGLGKVTQAQLQSALTAGFAAPVTAWSEDIGSKALMAKAPAPGTVKSRREIPEIGVTVLTLSNGVDVWLKPTDYRADQVVFSSYATGGTSTAPPEQYLNASLSSSIVGIGGIGGLSPVDLGKLLAGKIAGASAYISTYTHGVSGSATPRDLETALQMAYLHFTAPNRDPGALDLMKRRLEASLANQAQSPGAVFGERLRAINTVNHYTSKPIRIEDVGKLDAQAMWTFYSERFSNAANFTFFFVGNFTVDDITPLLATYLGSLPSKGAPDARAADVRLQFPATVQRETVTKGQEPRAQTVITFFSDTGLDEAQTARVRAAADIVENKLRDILREQLGGTYSVGVGYSDTSPQPGYGTTTVQFGSSPENAEKLSAAVMTEVDRLRREGPTAADLQAVKEADKNDLVQALRQNSYWLNALQSSQILGRDPKMIPRRSERTDALTVENVHEAMRKYLPADRYTVVTLMPEQQAPRTP